MKLGSYEWEVVLLSVKVALTALFFSLPLGVALARLLAKRLLPLPFLFNSLLHLPLVLPPVVVGYMLLVLMGRQGLLGRPLYDLTGFSFGFNWKGAALACAVMSFPLLVRSALDAMKNVDEKLEEAAKTLGAGPFKVFFTVALPLSFQGILSGASLFLARSLGEFGATITFVSSVPGMTETLPLAVYSSLQSPGGEAAAAKLCLVSLGVSLLSLLLSEFLSKKAKEKQEI